MKHTPGPWQIYNEDLELDNETRIGSPLVMGWDSECDESVDICTIHTDEENYAANAKLIKAAPIMLEALKDALNALECNCGGRCLGTCSFAVVKHAIEQATGESA